MNGTWPSLCEGCRSLRVVLTPKGSRFLLCERSKDDHRFAKYPRQPVFSCPGYVEKRQDVSNEPG